jgi:hypothetical protein
MKELVRLFVQIALMRKGPEDLPASVTVLIATAAGYFLVNCVVSAVLPPIQGAWFGQLVVDVLFTFAWYALLLTILRRAERFVQTTTAVFGFQIVLSPLQIASVWLIRQSAAADAWRFPIVITGLAIVVWMVAVNARVLKAALEWAMPACVALVILQILGGQALLVWLFPGKS